MEHLPPLLFVSLTAVLAPVLSSWTGNLRIPIVVFEIVLGVLLGPQCLGLTAFEGGLPYFSILGVAFLFFMAGTEIDVGAMRGPPLKLATLGWLLSVALAFSFAFVLSLIGGSKAWTLVGVALSTTALGVIIPVLRDADLLDTKLGKFAVAAGAIGEVGPIFLMSVLLATRYGTGVQMGLVGVFILTVLCLFWASMSVRPPALIELLTRTMSQSGQLPIRMSLLLMAGLAVLAERFDLDLALGAFAAGMAVGLAVRNAHVEVLHHKFDAIGFGFLIPVFFVCSGLKLDVRSVFSSPPNIAMMLAYAGLLLVVRGAQGVLFRKVLSQRETVALGFYSATSLSLIVALTDAAVHRGMMGADSGTALVDGGLNAHAAPETEVVPQRLRSSRHPSASTGSDSKTRALAKRRAPSDGVRRTTQARRPWPADS